MKVSRLDFFILMLIHRLRRRLELNPLEIGGVQFCA